MTSATGSPGVDDQPPRDGRLPESVSRDGRERSFGVYVHVPYCRVRCGYCDFNTYTATELGETKQSDFADLARSELELAQRVLDDTDLPERPVSTIFFGGGTPTLLPAEDLISVLDGIGQMWPVLDVCEVTTEANPDSVDASSLEALRKGGFTRVSFGMQSAVPSVLETLDRTHDPDRVQVVTKAARQLDFEISLDLIYGTPGETLDDWKRSIDAALECEPGHISAYSLIVEPGTKLAAQIKRGELPPPDSDLHAEMYVYADELLSTEGFSWYEISNWSRNDASRSQHNLAYWTGEDWWGVGPGAHSHVGGVRWWNVKHPSAYAERLRAEISPALGREVLDEQQKNLERVMLGIRLAGGLPVSALGEEARLRVAELIAEELVDPQKAFAGQLILTQRGRLLADAIVRLITD